MEYGDGLRECRKMLQMARAGKRNGYLLEGMGCPGGCVAGAGTIQPVKQSAASVEQFKQQAADQSCTTSPFLNRLTTWRRTGRADPPEPSIERKRVPCQRQGTRFASTSGRVGPGDPRRSENPRPSARGLSQAHQVQQLLDPGRGGGEISQGDRGLQPPDAQMALAFSTHADSVASASSRVMDRFCQTPPALA